MCRVQGGLSYEINWSASLGQHAGVHCVFLPSPFVHYGRQKSSHMFNQQSWPDSSGGKGGSWEEMPGYEERRGFEDGKEDSMAIHPLVAGQC